MAEFKSKLAQIAEKRAKLEQEYKDALAERKPKIGALAEKCKLLDENDAFFAGLFLEASSQLEQKGYREKLEAAGSSFLNSKRKKSGDKK